MTVDIERAWEIARAVPIELHSSNCSYYQTGGETLCDCLVLKHHLEYKSSVVYSVSKDQVSPSGNGTVILPLVLADINDRAEMGKARYGTLLRADNGRDALLDAYQEAIDLVFYLRQCLAERDRE